MLQFLYLINILFTLNTVCNGFIGHSNINLIANKFTASNKLMKLNSKPILTPEELNLKTLGMPRVIRRLENGVETYLMWCQGRESTFDPDNELPNLSTGRIFFMESKTGGLSDWKLHEDNPVMGPNKDEMEGDWWFFDAEHVGVGDVITPGGNAQSKFITSDGVFLLYTFGGNSDVEILDDDNKTKIKGAKLEIGVCVSQDGAHWSRVEGPHPYGSILLPGSPDEFDGQLVGWPNVLEVGGSYNMYYNTYNPLTKKFTIGLATGSDALKWTKKGPVLSGGESEDSFDFRGCSRRHVHLMNDGSYRMWYEGVSKDGTHSIGMATSNDAVNWARLSDEAIFKPDPDVNAWDSGGVGSPHLVYIPDTDRWRMYYVGNSINNNERLSIGVAESTDADGLYFERITPE